MQPQSHGPMGSQKYGGTADPTERLPAWTWTLQKEWSEKERDGRSSA